MIFSQTKQVASYSERKTTRARNGVDKHAGTLIHSLLPGDSGISYFGERLEIDLAFRRGTGVADVLAEIFGKDKRILADIAANAGVIQATGGIVEREMPPLHFS